MSTKPEKSETEKPKPDERPVSKDAKALAITILSIPVIAWIMGLLPIW